MKAFFSSIVLLSLVIGLIQTYSAANALSENAEEMKNIIVASQMISEKQYSMQHSFENAVGESLESIPENANDAEKSLLICEKINLLDFEVREGCISSGYEIDIAKTEGIKLTETALSLVRRDYVSLAKTIISELEPCIKFIREEDGRAIVGLNTKIDFKNSINLCDSGFILEDEVGGKKVRAVVTAGTVIE